MTRHWFESVAERLGPAYLRYSFTKGTEQESDFLVDVLGLESGMRVLDVGCGPGRHSNSLAAHGLVVVGVDISETFIELARTEQVPGATFRVADARDLRELGEFDAAISLCQGAFGLCGAGSPGVESPLADPDRLVLDSMAAAVRPGGPIAVSAFSAYFAVRWLEEGETFDAGAGVNHEYTEIRDATGAAHSAELWTTCFTPRELRLMAELAGLEVEAIWSVAPGSYRRAEPNHDSPEFLLVARRLGRSDRPD